MGFLTEAGKTPDMNKPKGDTEGDDKDYVHKGAGIYVRKGDEDKETAQKYKKDDGGSLRAISDDEANKIKDTQGDAGEKAASSTPQNQQGGDGVQQTEEPPKGTGVDPNTEAGQEYIKNLPDEDPAKPTKTKEKVSGNGYTGTKNKTLKDTNPIESENYQMELEPTDDVFEEKNKNNANPTPPDPLKLDNFIKNPKFPKRYIKVLERMINSKVTSETAKWTHFSDIEGGAGKISAQAGELMTMMGSTMSDDEWRDKADKAIAYIESTLDTIPGEYAMPSSHYHGHMPYVLPSSYESRNCNLGCVRGWITINTG